MLRRRAPLLVAVACAALVMSGCGGAPTPAETTPLFASEDEAFAAAEATYRGYVEAVNGRRDGDKTADPTEFLTGDALRTEIEGQQMLEQSGLRIVGHTSLAEFVGRQWFATSIEASVCFDSSRTKVVDDVGVDVTPADRDDRATFEITFVTSKGELLIAESHTTQDSVC